MRFFESPSDQRILQPARFVSKWSGTMVVHTYWWPDDGLLAWVTRGALGQGFSDLESSIVDDGAIDDAVCDPESAKCGLLRTHFCGLMLNG